MSGATNAYLNVERSVTGRKWVARACDDTVVAEIARRARISDTLARVLAGRGVEAGEADQYLNPRLRDSFPDPSSFQDMDKAAALIWDGLAAGRKFCVFADYDVDGACSAAQIVRWMRAVGHDADVYVPDRMREGYGPSAEAFARIREAGADIVITVDCGAVAHEAMAAARELGLQVIVIDHHLMGEDQPDVAALVNPNRPDDTSGCGHLAAAGVCFVLLAALNREGRRRDAFADKDEPDLLTWMDLAALGTICDVVPLTGFNRALVAQGLKILSGWQNTGLEELAQVAGVEGPASVYHAGFQLGPRINAGGRVGQSGLGASLLSTEDRETAAGIAAKLDGYNSERRQIEARVLDEARAQLEAQAADQAILIASGEDWHPGVIGIVAGRLKDYFGKPAIVIAIDRAQKPAIGKGSGRSVPGVNLGQAISAAKEKGLLLAGGGHAMAGGLTVNADAITPLNAFLDSQLRPQLETAGDAMALRLDGMLTPASADIGLCEHLSQAQPYGQGNAEPRFALADLRVAFAQRVGTDHVRFTLEDQSAERIDGVAFRCADQPLGEALLNGADKRWHAAGRIKLDEWRGRKRVQLHLEDLAAVG